jgi:hypothetical protein
MKQTWRSEVMLYHKRYRNRKHWPNTCIILGYADLASSVETLSIMNSCSYTCPDSFGQLRSSQVDAIWEDIPINNPALCPTETSTDTLTLDVV